MNSLTKAAYILLLAGMPVIITAQTTQPAATEAPQPPAQQATNAQNRPPRIQIREYNGLKGDLNAHDPVMIKQKDTYYIFTTGVGSKSSKNRIEWTNGASVFPRGEKFSWWNNDIPGNVGLWAPDIHYYDGKYHMYYSVSAWMNFNSSIGYATNVTLDKDDPNYKWIDQGQVISYKNGGEGVNVIDPNAFRDKDGKLWLAYGSYKSGLRLVELNPRTGKLFTETPKLTTLTTSLGEGVFIVKDPDYYYIFASRGRCCSGLESTYQVVIGRSKNITGPYTAKDSGKWTENKYSVFMAGNNDEPGRGHNGIFAEGDTTFMVYHAYARVANGASLLNIKPIYMGDDGWPTIEPTKKLFKMDKFEKKVFIGN